MLVYEPKAQKFIPKSIPTAEVISRLSAIMVDFDPEVAGFCKKHTSQRNAELHSGEIPFDGQKPSGWLPLFYKAAKVLLESVDKDLAFLFGEAEAKTAEKLIAAHADDAAKAVKGTINAHKVVWEKKDQAERDKLIAQADLWAMLPGREKFGPSRLICAATRIRNDFGTSMVRGTPGL